MKLRDYQHIAIEDVACSFKMRNDRVLLVSPTGSGKTVMFANIIQRAVNKGSTVFIIVHRVELVGQVSEKLSDAGVEHAFIVRGRTPDPACKVQVCMVQTLVKRFDKYKIEPDFIVIDEAHHAAAGSWKKVTQRYPNAKVLGVTATPERLDGKGLGDVFQALVRGPEVRDLIDRGFLAKPRYFAPTGFDDTGIRVVAGDYQKQDLEKAVNKSTITGCAVEHYKKLADGKPAVVFCVTVEHAKNVAAQFTANGYKFEVIDGTLSVDERKTLVKRLSNGEISGLCSCEIISEGFDLPAITAAILLRPTQSLSLYLQQVGRTLRPASGKENAIIIDHVGNIHRHGLAEIYRDWSLEGAVWRKKRKANQVKNRQCPNCFCVHEVKPVCPECGHIYKSEQRKLKTIDGELVEFTSESMGPLDISSVKDLILERTDEELSKLKATHPHRDFPGVINSGRFWRAITEPNPEIRERLADEWEEDEKGFRKAADKREVGMAKNYEQLLKLGLKRGYRCPSGWAMHVMAARA